MSFIYDLKDNFEPIYFPRRLTEAWLVSELSGKGVKLTLSEFLLPKDWALGAQPRQWRQSLLLYGNWWCAWSGRLRLRLYWNFLRKCQDLELATTTTKVGELLISVD